MLCTKPTEEYPEKELQSVPETPKGKDWKEGFSVLSASYHDLGQGRMQPISSVGGNPTAIEANTGLYAHYVFNTLDKDHTGILSFEDFVQGLSILSRGTLEEKLCWTFSLYDINHDGKITREEMTDIVTAIYELMGEREDGGTDDVQIKNKVDIIFKKMDSNRDGVITIEEFLDCCRKDKLISDSMSVFDSTI